MNIRWKPALVLLTVFSIDAAYAQVPNISCRDVVGGGGVSGTNGTYHIAATVAQAAIGCAAGQYGTLAQGFWHGRTQQISSGYPAEENNAPITSLYLSASPTLFTGSTQLQLRLPRSERIALILYDILGKPVKRLMAGDYSEGTITLQLAADHLPAGRYTVLLTAGTEQRSIPLLLVQ